MSTDTAFKVTTNANYENSYPKWQHGKDVVVLHFSQVALHPPSVQCENMQPKGIKCYIKGKVKKGSCYFDLLEVCYQKMRNSEIFFSLSLKRKQHTNKPRVEETPGRQDL